MLALHKLNRATHNVIAGKKFLFRAFHFSSKLFDGVSRPSTTSFDQFDPETAAKPILIAKKGVDLMNDPLFNKGVAFTYAERDRFEIRGLMPPVYNDIQEQASRVLQRLEQDTNDIGQYNFLSGLQDRNETLFYKLLIENIKRLAPIIYTPTVGKVCQRFGFLYRRPRGMYFSAQDRGEMAAMIYNWPVNDVDVIVITDGSRILGLGDLGVNGMGIPIGKLSLYVAAGGIHPSRVLPIMFDVGTNNEALLKDPFYLGLKQKRLTGDAYYALMDELLWAIRNRWPNVLVQFEDFSNNNAYNLLHKYRFKHLCFNDDIQGTGSVALAGFLFICLIRKKGIYSALRVQGLTAADITKQRIVCVGAGSAGLGVVHSLHQGMLAQGQSSKDAARNFWLLDVAGLLSTKRDNLTSGQKIFARDDETDGLSLIEVVKKVKPTILLGLSGVGGVFTEDVIKEMYKHAKLPIIFPLSNPTDRAECTAENAFKWTEGNAIFASGSPFNQVNYNGKVCYPSQGNNMFIYPGVGLGAVACGAKRISTKMFARAAETLSKCMTTEELKQGKVYPDVSSIRAVSLKVATEVCSTAAEMQLATKFPKEGETWETFLRKQMYTPQYAPLVWNDEGYAGINTN